MKHLRNNAAAFCVGLMFCLLPGVGAAQEAYTARPANVRAGPDRSYPLVAQLPAGAPLQMVGCLDDWSWCDVIFFGGGRGWVYAPALSYSYQDDFVPLYTYAPSLGIPIIAFSLGTYWDQYYRGRPWYRNRNEWAGRRIPHSRPGPPPLTTPPAPSRQFISPRDDGRRPDVRSVPGRHAPQSPPSVLNGPAPAQQRTLPQPRVQENRSGSPGRFQRPEPFTNRADRATAQGAPPAVNRPPVNRSVVPPAQTALPQQPGPANPGRTEGNLQRRVPPPQDAARNQGPRDERRWEGDR
ncbi:MAG: SH3 domain-containing protein [Pseudomonadota bacterium]